MFSVRRKLHVSQLQRTLADPPRLPEHAAVTVLVKDCNQLGIELEVRCGEQLWAFVPPYASHQKLDPLLIALASQRGILCGYLRRIFSPSFDGNHELAASCAAEDDRRILEHGGYAVRRKDRRGDNDEPPVFFTWRRGRRSETFNTADLDDDGTFNVDKFFERLRVKHGYRMTSPSPPPPDGPVAQRPNSKKRGRR